MSGHKTAASAPTRLANIQVQTSSAGQAIPIVWGTTRINCNLIGYYDFYSVAQKSQASGKGGSNSTTTGYKYYANVLLSLCEGPIADISRCWQGKDQVAMSSQAQLNGAGYGIIGAMVSALQLQENWSKFTGNYGQGPWSYLTSKHPDQAIGYSNTAYIGAPDYYLGESAAMPNNNFEVISKFTVSGSADANPKDVVNDFLINSIYGVPGWQTGWIGDLTQYSNYCLANGLLISPALDQQTGAGQFLQDIADATNSLIFCSEAKLKMVPRGDSAATGNGVTYTPNTTPAYDLTDDHFLTDSNSDPVRLVRSRPADAYNRFPVEYLDRNNNYNVSIAEARDTGSVYLYGHRKADPKQLHMICDGNVAMLVAQIEMQRQLYVRNTYEFDLPWNFALLEPGDLVTLTDEKLGLEGDAVMITGVDENEDGSLTFTAEEWPFGVNSHHAVAQPGNSGYNPLANVDPGNAAAPVIFQMPVALSKPNNTLAIATAGGANWGGCDVYVSEDGNTYKLIGSIREKARYGTASQALSAGSDPDTAHNLDVDLTLSGGTLNSGSQADADNYNTLCYLDGEFIGYETATLTATNQYSLTYLRRGVYGSPNEGHAAGVNFVRIDEAVFQYNLPDSLIGKPLWIKLASFNIYGERYQSLADVNAVNFTPNGMQPASLVGLTATGGIFTNHIAWSYPAGVHDVDYVELLQAAVNDRSQATVLTDAKYPRAFFDQGNLAPGQTVYYWARIFDTAGNASDYYPSSPTGGVPGTPSADPSAILTQLNDSITTSQLNQDLAMRIGKIDAPGAGLTDAVGSQQAQVDAAAESMLTMLLKMDDALNKQRTIKTKTDATMTIDPNTGTVTIIASAPVTTDVEQRLSNVEVEVNANANEIKSNTSQISTINGTLTSQQTQIDQQNATITLKADKTYVDSSIAGALDGVDPSTLQSNMDLLGQALSNAILVLNQARNEGRSAGANFATAQFQIQANADAISAESTARLSLAAIVNQNGAAITAEQTARADADSAMASQISDLQTQSGNNAAAIQNEQNARVSGDQANASSISTLQTTVNGNTSSIQSLQTSINGLSAEATLTLDVNGYVSGYGTYNDGRKASFIIRTDDFAIVAPGAAAGSSGTAPFVVGNINGVETVGVNGALVVDGSITATALAAKTITAASAVIADAAVNTLQLAGQAVTIPVSSYIAGTYTGSSTGSGWVEAISCWINSSGAPIDILASAMLTIKGSLHLDVQLIRYDTNSNYVETVYYVGGFFGFPPNGGVCGNGFQFTETPGPGSWKYSLQFREPSSGNTNSWAMGNRCMLLLETKR